MDRNKYGYVLFAIFLGFAGQLNAMFTARSPYGVAKRLEKPLPESLKTIKKEALEKKIVGEVGLIHLCDESLKHEYILTKDLWDTSIKLKGFMESFGQTEKNDAPSGVEYVDFSIDIIRKLFELIKFYLEEDEDERKNKLQERINQIDFKTLVSILLLANYLIIREDFFNEIITGVRNKIMTLNGINKSCFIELHKMDKDLKKQILTDEVWNIFFQEMKVPIARYCFNIRFANSISNPYIPPFSGNVAHKLLLNADGSRLLYVFSEADDKEPKALKNNIDYLSIMNIQPFGVLAIAKMPRQYPSWISENIFAYLDTFGEKNKIKLYDCEKNSESEKIMYPPRDKYYMDLHIHDLISSSDEQNKQKIILLCSLYSRHDKTTEYGLSFYNHKNAKIDYKELKVKGEEVKLLCYSKEMVTFLTFEEQMYGYGGYIVWLYQLSIKGDTFGTLTSYDKTEVVSKNVKEYGFSRCVVSPDGSKIAFTHYQDICIQSLNMFNEPWMNLVGKKPIASLVFSEDSQLLMVGYENGSIDAFDSDNGVKIGELSYEKKQVFHYNNALSFSSDGNIFAISGDNFRDWPTSDHLLIWKFMPDWQMIRDTYFLLLDAWKSNVSLEKVVLSKLICDQSREEKKELKFSEEEKQEFHYLDYQIQKMLADAGYVAQDQLGELPMQQVLVSEPVPPTQSIESSESPKANFLQQAKDIALYYWQRLRGIQPSSSDTKKSKAMQDFDKLMDDKNRYVNE